MHKHPVKTSWKKNTNGLSEAKKIFERKGNKDGAERCKGIVEDFVRAAHIFADRPARGKDFTVHTNVTIDPKTVKVAEDADKKRPLTLLKLNGVALLFVRPDAREEGLLLKICPHNGVRLLGDRRKFISEINRFNKSFKTDPIGKARAYHPLNANKPAEEAAA